MANEAQDSVPLEVRVLLKNGRASLTVTADGNIEARGSELSTSQYQISPPIKIYNVLWAEITGLDLEVSFLKRRNKRKSQSTLTHTAWRIEEAEKQTAMRWCEALMIAAYDGVEPRRRLRIFINPHGGPGKAKQIYARTVEPIFQAAHCEFETTFTERSGHASTLAKELSLDFDALVLLSGDGLLHEVYNGFAEHDDPLKAFALPVAPVPTGSANGMCVNLLGLEDGFDVGLACLNAIKGKPMQQDICTITMGDRRIFSYFSVALGLMADLDLGTEHLRWMGEFRFVIGFLQGVLRMKSCPITLEIKAVESDKDKLVEEFRSRREAQHRTRLSQELASYKHDLGADSLPVLKHTEAPTEDDGWTKFDKPLVYFYSGNSPFMARDLMQFPIAHASDGLIDIVAQEPTSRIDMLKSIGDAEKGASFWKDSQNYFKAHAYRVTPHVKDGNLAIDGEKYPLQPFAVECHRGLGSLLSPTGHYAANFDVPRPVPKRPQASNSGRVHRWRKWLGCH